MWTKITNLWNKKRNLDAAKSLEDYERMKDADFLAGRTNKEIKKFFLALTLQAKNTLKQADMVAKEIKKRGMDV